MKIFLSILKTAISIPNSFRRWIEDSVCTTSSFLYTKTLGIFNLFCLSYALMWKNRCLLEEPLDLILWSKSVYDFHYSVEWWQKVCLPNFKEYRKPRRYKAIKNNGHKIQPPKVGVADYSSSIFTSAIEYCAPRIYSILNTSIDSYKILVKHCCEAKTGCVSQ